MQIEGFDYGNIPTVISNSTEFQENSNHVMEHIYDNFLSGMKSALETNMFLGVTRSQEPDRAHSCRNSWLYCTVSRASVCPEKEKKSDTAKGDW